MTTESDKQFVKAIDKFRGEEADERGLSSLNDWLYACRIGDVSESWIESLHRTKRGAYFAGRKWMISEHNSYFKSRELIGKCYGDFMVRHNFDVLKMAVND